MQLAMCHYLTIYHHPETNTVLLFLRVMRFAHAKTHAHTHTDKKFKKEK